MQKPSRPSLLAAATAFVVVQLVRSATASQHVSCSLERPVAIFPLTKGRSDARRLPFLATLRGGVLEEDIEEYDDEYDVYDEEGESEDTDDEESIASLSSSTLVSVEKARSRKAAKTKKAVSSSLKQTVPAKKKKKKIGKIIIRIFHVPYIVRASLNPFTLFAMTRAYFASLFNISYLEEESSQGLRSALEEKAKKGGGGATGGKKGKRAMRPGQAKTLSDLPQLSA